MQFNRGRFNISSFNRSDITAPINELSAINPEMGDLVKSIANPVLQVADEITDYTKIATPQHAEILTNAIDKLCESFPSIELPSIKKEITTGDLLGYFITILLYILTLYQK